MKQLYSEIVLSEFSEFSGRRTHQLNHVVTLSSSSYYNLPFILYIYRFLLLSLSICAVDVLL